MKDTGFVQYARDTLPRRTFIVMCVTVAQQNTGPHTGTVLSVTDASNPARSIVRSVGLVN